MTTAFVDFPAQKQQKLQTTEEVLKRTYLLIEALKDNYRQYSIRGHKQYIEKSENVEYHHRCIEELKNSDSPVDFIIDGGKKYNRIVFVNSSGNKSVHCFIDKNTGDVYKSATWKSPAKGIRFNLLNEDHMEWLLENADWSSGYLYAL